MPRTPMDPRPVGRISDSSKQTADPSRVAMRIFMPPSVSRTEMSSSPSSRVMARMPLLRRFRRDSPGRRLTVPLRVTITRKRSPAEISPVDSPVLVSILITSP